MNPFDVTMYSILYLGLLGAIILGVVAAIRRRAVWVVASSVSLLLGSIPLLLGGIGVIGIAAAATLLVVARSMPDYHQVRWWARAFASLCVLTVLALQVSGALRGNRPSLVDWILVGLAGAMLVITAAPVRGRAKPALRQE